jgi:hypothetical protein
MTTAETPCRHHWLLGPAGAVVHGVCKRCGAERDFAPDLSLGHWRALEEREPLPHYVKGLRP